MTPTNAASAVVCSNEGVKKESDTALQVDVGYVATYNQPSETMQQGGSRLAFIEEKPGLSAPLPQEMVSTITLHPVAHRAVLSFVGTIASRLMLRSR